MRPRRPSSPSGPRSTPAARRGSARSPREPRTDAGDKDTSNIEKRRSVGGIGLSVRVLGFVAIVTMLAVNLVPIGLQWIQQEQEYRAILAEVEQTKQHKAELTASLAGWDDPDYVAAQARSRLGFVRPGETQYTILDLPQSEVTEAETPKDRGVTKPWAALLLDSMKDSDEIPASSDLIDMEPTEDPNRETEEDEE